MKKKGRTTTMPKPRAIPPIDTKSYAKEGHVKATADLKHQDVLFKVDDHCSCFLNRAETMTIALQLAHAGYTVWGDEFLSDMQSFIDSIRNT